MTSRVRSPALRGFLRSPEEAAALVQRGWTIGTTGTTTAGYPSAFFRALADRGGRVGELTLWSVAPLGDEVDGALARSGLLSRRLGMQSNPDLTRSINEGTVAYADWGVSSFTKRARSGAFGRLDLAVLEVASIAEDGSAVPSLCLGDAAALLERADRVILEVNGWLPLGLEGFHDVYLPALPPSAEPIPLLRPSDRIGTPRLRINPKKVVAVIETETPPLVPEPAARGSVQKAIAGHVRTFLEDEWRSGRFGRTLPPLQLGLGALGDALLEALAAGPWEPLVLHSPLIGDGALKFLLEGSVRTISGSGLFLSRSGLEALLGNLADLRRKLVLRPVDVVASPELIARFGCIALNSALEVDLYGHVNSSHAPGGRLLSGVGGSLEYARNAALSIFATPSVAKAGAISSVVSRVCHVDHTEHEVDVVVTEQGIVDLRGTDPRERAALLIERCAHPSYRGELQEWVTAGGGVHEPQVEEGERSFHARFLRTGTMRSET